MAKKQGYGFDYIGLYKESLDAKNTFTQVAEEFGDIGKQQGFTRCLTENCFNKDEIEEIINSLD